MAKRFKDNRPTEACNGYTPTMVELKEERKAHKKDLKLLNSEMDTLSQMMNRYRYNDSYLETLVGQCYILISNTEEDIMANKERLSKMSKKGNKK